MQINNISFKGIEKTNNNVQTQRSFLGGLIPDIFKKSSSAPDSKQIDKDIEDFKQIKGKYDKPRFKDEDLKDYKVLALQGKIDAKTVKEFASNTDFSMKTISSVYIVEKENKGFKDLLNNCINKLENKPYNLKFSTFEPETEITLVAMDDKDGYQSKDYVFDYNKAEILGYSKTDFKKNKAGKYEDTITTYDYRNNTVATTYQDENFELKKEVIEHKNKDGSLERKDILEKSDIDGVLNLRYEYPDGKTQDIAKATVDKKTGIKTIKKDMKSTDGTRTEFLYEDDPQGNRIVDYKITSADGKILMKNSQTFEVVDDNHFISSSKGHKYDITTTDDSITVKDIMHTGKEASIKFKNSVTGNKKEIVGLLKKVSGDELFETMDCVKNLNGLNPENALKANSNRATKNINVSDNLYIFLHELGHSKDGEYYSNTDFTQTKQQERFYEQNPTIQKAYLKERQEFNKHFPKAQREHISYFTQKVGHYQGKWGGLQEVIAETNALCSSYTSGDAACLSARSQYLQQHFPKTIAAIQEAMYYKNDMEALKYYGT